MNYVVVNTETWRIVRSRFETFAGAKRSATAFNKRGSKVYGKGGKVVLTKCTKYVAMTAAEFNEKDVLVETYNMLNPEAGPIMIPRSQRGGCCDPATETYWSM